MNQRTEITDTPITGGCQCGRIRYRAARLGRSSVCHCRMCQRAVGGFYAALVVAHDLQWTKGTPTFFASSTVSHRGFCNACGTPLSFENIDGSLSEITTATLDHPDIAPPTLQINHRYAWPFTDSIGQLPLPDPNTLAENDAWNAAIRSNQSLPEDG